MPELFELSQNLGNLLRQRRWRVATAESCTGGGIAHALTAVPGSSDWLECGFVTYSNASKAVMLGVPDLLIARCGAVSSEVAAAMATGACQHAGVAVGVSVTGIAGPGGGSLDKPVGTVWFGWCTAGKTDTARHVFEGDREAVRAQAVLVALRGLHERLLTKSGEPSRWA